MEQLLSSTFSLCEPETTQVWVRLTNVQPTFSARCNPWFCWVSLTSAKRPWVFDAEDVLYLSLRAIPRLLLITAAL